MSFSIWKIGEFSNSFYFKQEYFVHVSLSRQGIYLYNNRQNCVHLGVVTDLYINIFCLSGEGEEREGLKYMLCTAELQNTAEVEDTDFNYEMRNISHIYTNDIMPLPVSLTKICKFDLQDIEPWCCQEFV